MTTAAATPLALPPLVDLLDRETSAERMRQLLGPAAADVPRHLWERALFSPAREILSRPSKEVRARLVQAGWALGGGDSSSTPEDLPWVVELLHAGSLIVDDIEDDSETRRGGPAVHRMFGVPVALNAGNWLYFLPFTLLESLPVAAGVRAELFAAASRAVLRCHHGQALDLSVRVDALDPEEIAAVAESISSLKTGSLLELATVLGATAAGASPDRVRALATFGRELGVALQMLDDVSGLTVPRRAHKGREDLRHGRATWPWAWVTERLAPAQVRSLLALQRQVGAGTAEPAVLRAALANHVGERGIALARGRLAAALFQLRASVGDHPVIEALEEEADRLCAEFLGKR